MSEKKEYTAEEVARMIADRTAEIVKKYEISSEYIEGIMVKSKNSAHEIDPGKDPISQGTEMSASMESSESPKTEDQPLQGQPKKKKDENEEDEEDEEDENEEGESEEDEEDDKEQEDKDEYEFKKSEACGHVIVYKRLVKGEDNAEIQHATEKPKKMTDAQNATFGSSVKTGARGSMKGHKADPSPGQIKGEQQAAERRKKMKAEAAAAAAAAAKETKKSEGADHKVKDAPDIEFDKAKKNSPKQEIEKCGDMKVNKSEKLYNFLKKNTSNNQ